MVKTKLAVMFLTLAVAVTGFAAGRYGQEQAKQKAVEAEYVRVVSAIARTMRCQTVDEREQGQDHECDPSEIEQDAGLVDADGAKISERVDGSGISARRN